MLEIDKILVNIDSAYYPAASELKYMLTPIISRNKEEQEITYSIFDRLNEKTDLIKKEATTGEIKNDFKWKKLLWLLPLAAIVAFALYKLLSKPPDSPKLWGAFATHKFSEIAVNDTILFTAELVDSADEKRTKVNWTFEDGTVNNQFTAAKIFSDTGTFSITAELFSEDGAFLGEDEIKVHVVCEHTPSLTVQKQKDSSDATAKRKRGNIIYTADIKNPSPDSSGYIYNWFVNETTIKNNNKPALSLPERLKGNRNIKLVVQRTAQHCGEDSLTASFNDTPAVYTTIENGAPLQLTGLLNWNNILLSLLFLIALPALTGLLIYRLIFNSFSYKQKEKSNAAADAKDEPHEIQFNNREHAIHPEHEIEQLADVLRKRQAGDTYKLDIKRTIRTAFKTGGLPLLQFTPRTKPTEVLVFMDKENPDSHMVKLFEYLINRLQAEQVNIVVYDYYKEPLFLTNEKLNHIRIPADRVAALYPDTALFIFGDARHFILTSKGTPKNIKSWVTDKLSNWETKLLITPFAKNDWDKKEQLLSEAKFTVIPADASAYQIIEKIVYRQTDHLSQKKPVINTTYEARFLNFNEIATLKRYLANDHLFKWVCCLAVYPDTDWNFTLAMGHVLEKKLQRTEPDIELVNYSNLLKISRISWLNDGLITDSIKVAMLKELDNETEALARETLMEQLDEISESISPTSLVKRQHQVLEQVNNFLVKSYKGEKHTRQEKIFITNVLKRGHLDSANTIYLDTAENTLLKNPRGGDESVSPDDYLKMSSVINRIRSLTAGISSFTAIAVLAYFLVQSISPNLFIWKTISPVNIRFILDKNGINLPGLTAAIGSFNSSLPLNGDSVSLTNIDIPDTTQKVPFIISGSGNIISADSIQLNASEYTIHFSETTTVPVNIFYNTPLAKQLAENIVSNLPLYFDVIIGQSDFTDTAVQIEYFDTSQFRDAQTLRAIIREQTGKDAVPVVIPTRAIEPPSIRMKVAANESAVCTVIPVSALPAPLNEIWKGGTSNRLLNINLQQRILYYSTGDVNTYGTYRINEICLAANGTYKIITQTSQGYKLFFIRNISAQSFELSVCQDFYRTKEELAAKTEANCDRFNRMVWYYESNTSNLTVYLPASPTQSDPVGNEMKKFISIVEGDNNNNASGSVMTITSYANKRFVNSPDLNFIKEAIYNYPISTEDISAGNTNPFKRNYVIFGYTTPNIKKTAEADCNKTFTSVAETEALQNPLVVCNLDLSGSNLTTMPKELYNYTNMQQLTLGTTNIPQTEIDQLQRALPNCKIDFTIYQPKPQTNNEKEILLGNIIFDRQGQMSSSIPNLIEKIAQQLRKDKSSKVRIEATYTTAADRKNIESYLTTIEQYFEKSGIDSKSEQLTKNIMEQQRQQQQQNSSSIAATVSISLIGINFPDGFDNQKSGY